MVDSGSYDQATMLRRRALAEAMMKAPDKPLTHWAQGLSQMANTAVGAYDLAKLDAMDRGRKNADSAILAQMYGMPAPASADTRDNSGASKIAAALGFDWPSSPANASATPSVTSAPSVAAPMGNTKIPSGEIDPRLKDAISSVSSRYPDIDPAYMTRLALVENGGRVEGGSPLSSAQGPFQFLKGTAQQYGLSDPSDPNASTDAAARFTADNRKAIANALGREPTPGELYLAHQQGAGGAIKLLQNPDAAVESVIGAQAARNNAAAPGMTAGQFANKWTSKFQDIVQTVDPGQKNIIDAAADGPPQQVASAAAPAQDDSAAVPAAAQPTQGNLPAIAQAMSGHGGGILAGATPEQRRMIELGMRASPGSAAYKMAAAMATSLASKSPLDQEIKQADLRSKSLANIKAQRDLEGEGASPLTQDDRKKYGIPAETLAYWTKGGDLKFGPVGTKITNTVGGEAVDGNLRKELDKKTANVWGGYMEQGAVSASTMQDMQLLDELGKSAPQGPIVGRLAERFPGFSSAGAAFQSIIKRVAPTLRAPGSGSTSDIEYDGMLQSLPALQNKPEANAAISQMMQAKALINIERADIVSAYRRGEISSNEAETRIGKINKRSIMTPEIRKAIEGLGEAASSKPLAGDASPSQSEVQDGAVIFNPKTGERRVLQNGKWVPMA